VSDARKKTYAAFGAFMLTRGAALLETEGWQWLRLEVADDMGLGLLMKKNGKRCEMALLYDCVAITWYASLGEMGRLMQKNWFGIMGRFSVVRTLGLAVLTLAIAWPHWLGLLAFGAPLVQGLAAVAVMLAVAAGVVAAAWLRRPLVPALFVPIGLTLAAGIIARAAWRGFRQGGIEWRGHLYPSAELRAHQRVKI
jgi:hypothetical protein